MLKQGIQLMSRTFDGILNLVNFCAQFKNIIQSRSIVLFYFILFYFIEELEELVGGKIKEGDSKAA